MNKIDIYDIYQILRDHEKIDNKYELGDLWIRIEELNNGSFDYEEPLKNCSTNSGTFRSFFYVMKNLKRDKPNLKALEAIINYLIKKDNLRE